MTFADVLGAGACAVGEAGAAGAALGAGVLGAAAGGGALCEALGLSAVLGVGAGDCANAVDSIKPPTATAAMSVRFILTSSLMSIFVVMQILSGASFPCIDVNPRAVREFPVPSGSQPSRQVPTAPASPMAAQPSRCTAIRSPLLPKRCREIAEAANSRARR